MENYSYRKCTICGKRRLPKSNMLLSSFPLNPDRCKLWVKASGIEDLVYLPIEKLHELKFICGSHFAQECFNAKGNRLLSTAVPTLGLTRPFLSDELFTEFPFHVKSFYDKIEKRSDIDQQPGPSYTPSSSYIDSSDIEVYETVEIDPNQDVDIDEVAKEEEEHENATLGPAEPVATTSIPNVTPAQLLEQPPPEASTQIELDPEMLNALGEATDDAPEFGESILTNLANLWTSLLKKGLTKESKEKLYKEYLVPKNCTLLQAPKLNAEISAAVSDFTRNRDKKLLVNQQQLGIGISAINRAMTALLQGDDKVTAIKHLSNGCRLLCDLHYLKTSERIKLVMPNLDKQLLQITQDLEREDTLFGSKLSEKIKAAKAIEKQGLQIKKVATKLTTQLASGRRISNQGNWNSHSRSSNRGGEEVAGDGKPLSQPEQSEASSSSSAALSSQHQQSTSKGPPQTHRR